MLRLRGFMIAGTLALAGCHGNSSAPSGQVLATVNGEELTASQFRTRLQQVKADPADPVASRSTFNDLVEQTLLSQAARRDGLDKKPEIARIVEQATNAILAKAYIDRFAPPGQVRQYEIQSYFDQHPYYFGDRKQYKFVEVVSPAPEARIAPFQATWQRQPDVAPAALADAMTRAGVAAQVNTVTMTSDQMPEVIAKGIVNNAAGSRFSYRMDDVQHMVLIDGVAPAPLQLQDMERSIGVGLDASRRAKLVRTELDRLKADAQIKYAGAGQKILNGQVDARRPDTTPTPTDHRSTVSRGATDL